MDGTAMSAVDRQVVDVGGPVHFIDFGGAGAPMVLVHGLGGSAINWLAVGPALARRWRVVALDLPGFGRTPPAGRSARLASQREVLGRFLDAVIGAPAVVVGNSMGGLIAMMEAAAGAGRISRLVLAAPAQPPAVRAGIDPAVFAAFLLYSMPGLGAWYVGRRSARLGAEGLVREMLSRCCVDPSRVPPDVRRAHVELVAERLAGMPWNSPAFLGAARSTVAAIARRRRFYEMARRITSPVLLIHGTRDRLVPLAASRELSRLRPDWAFEVFEDIGHIAQLEAPDRFVAVVNRWLDGSTSALSPGA
jgi:glycerol-3-phosphate dehydrogenase